MAGIRLDMDSLNQILMNNNGFRKRWKRNNENECSYIIVKGELWKRDEVTLKFSKITDENEIKKFVKPFVNSLKIPKECIRS